MKGVDFNKWGDEEDLEGVWGGQTMIRLHCMEKYIFNTN